MPFKSRAQAAACFAKRDAGTAKGWNCEEWAHATPSIKKLPKHVKKEKKGALIELEKQATTVSQFLGVRAASLYLGVS